MTDAPIALRIHDGHGSLPEEVQPLVAQWLRANRINPDQVSVQHPLTVLTVPYAPATEDGTSWLVQIIVFHQFYVGPDGAREDDLLTHRPVCFQRTVPLTVAFPTPTPAGDADEDTQDRSDDVTPEPEPEPGPEPVREEAGAL